MATAADVRRIAETLEGTTEAPHFDRLALRVVRIYATLPPDEQTINLMLTPAEQALKCTVAPEIYSAIPNGWGRNGATTAVLAAMDEDELRAGLTMAWEHGRAKKPRSRL